MFKIIVKKENMGCKLERNDIFRYFKPDLDLRLEADLGNKLFYEMNYGEIN